MEGTGPRAASIPTWLAPFQGEESRLGVRGRVATGPLPHSLSRDRLEPRSRLRDRGDPLGPASSGTAATLRDALRPWRRSRGEAAP